MTRAPVKTRRSERTAEDRGGVPAPMRSAAYSRRSLPGWVPVAGREASLRLVSREATGMTPFWVRERVWSQCILEGRNEPRRPADSAWVCRRQAGVATTTVGAMPCVATVRSGAPAAALLKATEALE